MATLVVGDLHGQTHFAEKALASGHFVVFLGDYLDSFTREVIDQIDTVECVLEAWESGRAVALVGNHELSYLSPFYRCSGYNSITQYLLENNNLLERIVGLPSFCTMDGFTMSHAGVSAHYDFDEYIKEGVYEQIGYSRGGYNPIGGLYWCDWRYEFKPQENHPQIVGHTRGNHIRQRGNSYCVDVLENNNPRCLLIDNGEVSVWNLDQNTVDNEYKIVYDPLRDK